MISNTFALPKLYRKKLKEVIKYSSIFFEFKYVRITKSGNVLLAKNVIQYIFKPKKIDLKILLSLLDSNIANDNNSIREKIDCLYATTVAKQYNLSSVKNNSISLRELLRRGAIKEPLYVEYYINNIYGYVKDKHSVLVLSIITMLDSAKNVAIDSTNRVEVIIKNAILRELSLLRSPPNRISLGL
ncbi:MAG: hypothetical protein AB7V50_11260, partial [Vampirovibrionia bacterium]